MSLFQITRNWYARYERPISSLSLIAGFLFDILTLRRVDTLFENIWLLGHIVLVGIFIILVHVNENKDEGEKNPEKIHFWYVNILQFVFGGLLSAYLVFYFRSTDIFTTWPFLLILFVAFVANESMKRHYVRLNFQISLFFLSIYSFAIFFVPILMHKIGTQTFVIAGGISLFLIFLFVKVLFFFAEETSTKNNKNIFYLILAIFAVVNFLYFTNLIPPIPLSLKDGGVYHAISKNQNGDYDVLYEDAGWTGYFKLYPKIQKVSETPVYAYSAVFSPNDLNLTILHEWQFYEATEGKWITASLIGLPVLGGRDGGFRTYSKKSNLTPGKWRVNIKTVDNLLIGRIRFYVENVSYLPTLKSEVKK